MMAKLNETVQPMPVLPVLFSGLNGPGPADFFR
jgi:hypothetical protein